MDTLSSKVSVLVRCRPLAGRELLGKRCLTLSKDTIQIGDKTFNFDSVFGEESNQSAIYESCVRSLVSGCFHGYNGTIFACKLKVWLTKKIKIKAVIYFLTYTSIRWSNWQWENPLYHGYNRQRRGRGNHTKSYQEHIRNFTSGESCNTSEF